MTPATEIVETTWAHVRVGTVITGWAGDKRVVSIVKSGHRIANRRYRLRAEDGRIHESTPRPDDVVSVRRARR